jgi:ATP-dependent protease ClpP protease subunit
MAEIIGCHWLMTPTEAVEQGFVDAILPSPLRRAGK